MIPPTKCPICKQPLINEFGLRIGSVEDLDKICRRSLIHSFNCHTSFSHGEERVDKMKFSLLEEGGEKIIIFYPTVKRLVAGDRITQIILPYFEPNLPFKELLDKVNLYLVFS